MNTYILASNKDWNITAFCALREDLKGNWVYISSNKDLNLDLIDKLKPRYIFFPHWSNKVPAEIYKNFECVCFHMTDLPFGRGGTPLQNLIVRGIQCTKLSALRMTEEIDAGPIYIKKDLNLIGNAKSIYKRASQLSMEIISWMVENEPIPVPQNGDITNFERRTPEQSLMPEVGEIEFIYDHVRMLDAPGYPKSRIEHGEFVVEFSNAELTDKIIKTKAIIKKRG